VIVSNTSERFYSFGGHPRLLGLDGGTRIFLVNQKSAAIYRLSVRFQHIFQLTKSNDKSERQGS